MSPNAQKRIELRRRGLPMIIWKDGKVREVPAQIVAAKKPALSEVERALPRRSVVWGARLSRVLVAVSRRDELPVLEMH